ncbi:MAG: F-type H+-transporting ATPase subunit b [Chloroflexota bacterium]|nr:F-type H+-transporting ATPase subunit b [Chloroflexota bacterium]
MPLLGVAGGALDPIIRLFAEAEVGFQLNLFWIIAQAGSFLLFFVILYFAAFKRIGGVLEERRSKIEQGLRDADDARKEREQAASERLQVLAQARGEAEEILTRAQKVADESRQRDLTETRAQLEQMRTQATADIAAEKDRALADVRSQVAELALAAAARVVGETMTSERERRLVNEFLTEVGKK